MADKPGAVAGSAPVQSRETGGNRAEARNLLRLLDAGFSAMFEEVAPAVVVIEAVRQGGSSEGAGERSGEAREFQEPLPEARMDQRSEGSGFVFREDGFLMTNLHVVDGAQRLEVRFRDGRRLEGRLLAADEKTDVAVLKVEASGLPAVRFADSDTVRVGQLVGAIGAPYHQEYSFSCGWISGKGRTNLLGAGSNLYEDYLQTDAFINPGNSGGPLFDVDGAVVGMNTLVNGLGRGLAFAVPSNLLRDVGEQLIHAGRVVRPWVGVRVEGVREDRELQRRLQIQGGVLIKTIEAGSPAYGSGLRVADVIQDVDGVHVDTAQALQREVFRRGAGKLLKLGVWRAGAWMQVPVTTGELPEPSRAQPKAPARETLGLTIRDSNGRGARVEGVLPEGQAAKSGIQADDLIDEVGGKRVSGVEDFLRECSSSLDGKTGDPLKLGILRKGRRIFIPLKIEKRR
jgi:serine protease Do